MDQLKDILRQAIKYRFWIAVGISALLPIIAYAAGSGPIKQKAIEQTNAITAADTEVKKYSTGVVPNAQYKPIVDEKKDELVKDVNQSWKMLYSRQAPLLTWPKIVEDRFRTWERKWPENVDPSAVQLAIIEYVTAYPAFVTEVYQTFHPFDVVEGTGVVSAPAEDVLLHPFAFTIENPPELSKVWAAQERLWTQRTILEVIAQVNKHANDWNTATIKQINLLEVGNAVAQDQKSIAKGETLTEAPPIANPAAPPPPAEPGTDPNAPPAPGGQPQQQQISADSVYYIKPATENNQFKILPFQLSVLIEQDRIQDLLVALENSPMAIQVKEFEMSKPLTRVTKPVKGQSTNYADYSGTGGGLYGQMPGASAAMPGSSRVPAYFGPRSIGAGGRDMRGTSRAEKRKAEEELAKSAAGHTIHDPYFNIVEVTVYGQTRFYNPPPPEPAPTPSVAETTPAPATPEGTPPATEAPKAEGEAPKAEGEAPKEAAPAPAPNGEAPKAEPAAAPSK